jgi:hypothetical protein
MPAMSDDTWVQLVDERNGNVYFHNTRTGRSQVSKHRLLLIDKHSLAAALKRIENNETVHPVSFNQKLLVLAISDVHGWRG